MPSFLVFGSYRIEQLHAELDIAYQGKIKCLRSNNIDPVTRLTLTSFEVEHDGTISLSDIQPQLDAHIPKRTLQQKILGLKIDTAISKAKSGLLSNGEVQKILAFILQYLRSDESADDP